MYLNFQLWLQTSRKGVIVVDQTGNLVNAAIGVFCFVGLTGIYGILADGVTAAYALFCLSYGALFALSATRICHIQMAGERVSSVYADIRKG